MVGESTKDTNVSSELPAFCNSPPMAFKACSPHGKTNTWAAFPDKVRAASRISPNLQFELWSPHSTSPTATPTAGTFWCAATASKSPRLTLALPCNCLIAFGPHSRSSPAERPTFATCCKRSRIDLPASSLEVKIFRTFDSTIHFGPCQKKMGSLACAVKIPPTCSSKAAISCKSCDVAPTCSGAAACAAARCRRAMRQAWKSLPTLLFRSTYASKGFFSSMSTCFRSACETSPCRASISSSAANAAEAAWEAAASEKLGAPAVRPTTPNSKLQSIKNKRR
mmetsp:Transcript_113148/g.283210  ORF Transcript_113148/g.283210 Transcript_113148/m.283210 type:complete len:281 (-) Transcript_113148:136-978(-)